MPNNFSKADSLRATLPKLAIDLARELGEGWSRADDGQSDWNVYLAGPERMRLLLGVDSDKPEHVVIHSTLPAEVNSAGASTHGLRTASIRVAGLRGVAVIAQEIRRRLLPSYRDVLERARERVEEVRQEQRQRDEVVVRVAGALGVQVPAKGPHAGPNDDVRFGLPHLNHGHVEVRTGGFVRIGVSGGIDTLWDTIVAIGRTGVRP